METALAVIFFVSLGASLLTFFSGFGLGTILMPVMAFYFDIKLAIAATAIVHFSNNIFKGILLFKNINRSIFLKFAIPALIGSVAGAILLMNTQPLLLFSYQMFETTNQVYLQELLVAVLMLTLCIMEWLPSNYFRFDQRHTIAGGFLTGFTGGFSGMQGALRSSFLIQLKLTKEEFVATGTAISLVIDACRLCIYFAAGKLVYAFTDSYLVLIGLAGAMIGALLGKMLLKKTTFGFIKIITTVCIVLFSFMLGLGLLHA
jgi:uncharacterized protein